MSGGAAGRGLYEMARRTWKRSPCLLRKVTWSRRGYVPANQTVNTAGQWGLESYFVELSREVSSGALVAAGPGRVPVLPGHRHDQPGQEAVQHVVVGLDGQTVSPHTAWVLPPVTALHAEGSPRRSIRQVKLGRLRLCKALWSCCLKVDHRLSIFLGKLRHRLNIRGLF